MKLDGYRLDFEVLQNYAEKSAYLAVVIDYLAVVIDYNSTDFYWFAKKFISRVLGIILKIPTVKT